MTRTDRDIVNRIVETLLDMAADRRSAVLDTLCAGIDPGQDVSAIRREAERLLAEDESIPVRLAMIAPSPAATRSLPARAETQTALEHVPPIIGRFHIRSPLGTGGMGQVFLADQRSPIRRLVAVKLIRSGFDSREVLARFDAERQALARMEHPNIARVLDAGMSEGGRPYFAMEYVDGLPITRFADERRLTIRERLELFTQVCDAIAHAHTKGVIHRDLKPSNVLAYVDTEGRRTVKVIDFGIAKALVDDRADRQGDSACRTEAGVIIGTYEYMSPEQASMSTDIDTRADVYSLGVLLYELLVGVRPFEREVGLVDPDEPLRRLIREVDAPRPSSRIGSLSSGSTKSGVDQPTSPHRDEIAASRRVDARELVRVLRRELEWIPLKALRKDRQRRYVGPAELARDVQNYLAGRPLIAAPESRVYRSRKFIQQHRAALLATSALLLLMLAGVVGTSLGLVREQTARRLADENGRRANWSAYRSAIVAAELALQGGDSIRLRQAIDAAPASLRGFEWDRVANAADPIIATLHHSPGDPFRVSLALMDNRRALSCTGAPNGQTVMWDLQTGDVLRREAGGVATVDPSGRSYCIVRPSGALEAVDVDSGRVRWSAAAPASGAWRIQMLSVSPDGRFVAAWDGASDAFAVFDCETGAKTSLPAGVPIDHLVGFASLGDSAPRIVFFSTIALGPLSIDLATRVSQRDPRGKTVVSRQAMAIGPDNDWCPSVWNRKTLPIFDAARPSLFEWSAVFMPRRELLAIGREDGSIEILTPRNGTGSVVAHSAETTQLRRIVAGPAPFETLAGTPDESRLLLTMLNGDVGVVSVDPAPVTTVAMKGIFAAQLSVDMRRIVGVGWGDISCADVASGIPLWSRNISPHNLTQVAWSPDGSKVVATSDPAGEADGLSDFFVLDGATGRQLAAWCDSPVSLESIRGVRAPDWAHDVRGLCFAADGASMFVAHSSGGMSRVDSKDWRELPREGSEAADADKPPIDDGQMVGAHVKFRGGLQRSPDGKWIAQVTIRSDAKGAPSCGPLLLRDGHTGAIVRRVAIDGLGATAAAWGADSATLAIAFSDRERAMVVTTDVTNGAERFRRQINAASPLCAISFSSGGERVIAFTSTRRMIILDASSGEEILSSPIAQTVVCAAATADGALLTAGTDALLNRIESRRPVAAALDDAMPAWPAEVTRPQTIEQARQWVSTSNVILHRAYDAGEPVDDVADRSLAADDPVRALVRAIALRCQPNINLLNSDALSHLLHADPTPAELMQAQRMLEVAIAIKPHSAGLQRNLGGALFMERKFAECIEPLLRSEKITTEHGNNPSPRELLRLAIAAHATGDARAASFLTQAQDQVELQQLAANPDVAPLLKQAQSEFAAPSTRP